MSMAIQSGALDFIGFSLSRTMSDTDKSLRRLATGRRVVTAADDPAALGVASKLNSRLISTHRALRNANEGLAVLEVSDGTAESIVDTLQRMRELAVQSASETLANKNRAALQTEFGGLLTEISRLSDTAQHNGINLGDGSVGNLSIQVGIDSSGTNRIDISLGDFSLTALGLDGGTVQISNVTDARTSIDAVDGALHTVNSHRSIFGALVSRIEASIGMAQTNTLSIAAAEGRMVDADFARETSVLARSRILLHAGQASKTQARRMSYSVVRLLR